MGVKLCSRQDIDRILSKIPQQDPFRFIDEIVELSEEHIISRYRFKESEYFYKGHFPDNPITPGVILIESMAQGGLVALGLYLSFISNKKEQFLTLFSECNVDFSKVVKPGDTVTIYGKKIYFRHKKLKARVEMKLENGDIAASGTIAGLGVVNE